MDKFQIENIDPKQFLSQTYDSKDINLLNPIQINKEFGEDNDIIEFHLTSPDNNILYSNYNYKNYKNRNVIDNSTLFDNLERDEELSIMMDEGVRTTKKDAWRDNRVKQKEVRLVIEKILKDKGIVTPDEIDRIYELVRNQPDY